MKNKFGKIIIVLFIISFFIDFYSFFQEDLEEIMLIGFNEETIFTIGMFIVIALFMNIIKFFFVIGIYFCIKIATKKVRKEKLSQIDFEKYDGYFRDILKNYDVIVLSYIDDFEIDYPKDLVALLLNLKNKGKISFDEVNNKIIINNVDLKLSKSETYLLDHIIDGKVRVTNNYENFAMSDAKDYGLLKSGVKSINVKKIVLSIFLFIVMNVIIFNLMLNINLNDNSIFIILVIIFIILWVLIIAFVFFFLPIYGFIYLVKSINNPYVRSDLGEEVNVKLEGLKNYLKDFSSIDEKNVEELIIWEDYLIYSVLFKQNKIVIDEIYQKYFIQ